MGAALRIILLIIIAWYLYRFVDRYIVPFIFGSPKQEKATTGKNEKEFRKTTRQGDITITDYGKSKNNIKSEKDDYVDFEEVD